MALFNSRDPTRAGPDFRFEHPAAELLARTGAEVPAVLDAIDRAAAAGRWVVMAVAYDAAPAFDPAMVCHPGDFPLVAARVYERPAIDDPGAPVPAGAGPAPYAVGAWEPLVDRAEYGRGFSRIRDHILGGDSYQVNYTFPLTTTVEGDLEAWYADLCDAQRAGYCAYLAAGPFRVLSLSPELFVERAGPVLTMRPMKGTAPRGRWTEEDDERGAALTRDPKSRAENVMIVDLLRNDLGRIARPGGVSVPALFTAERYPTLWQLTSIVRGRCERPPTLAATLGALFPCGSVTGAPKIETMRIIREVERHPRGLYTGAVGIVRPGGDFTLSVAIRTVVVDTASMTARCGVGSGVTADSSVQGEYDECLLKAEFLRRPGSPFSLLESLRLENGVFRRRERHLARMAGSARALAFCWRGERVVSALDAVREANATGIWKVRLLVSREGECEAEAVPLGREAERPWHVAFASRPVDPDDWRLHHKTTRREVYERARDGTRDADDVLLWNIRGEVTESTIANLVVRLDGRLWTPPRECGLLAGTFRAELLESGMMQERVVTRDDVARADELFLVNAVRGWIRARLVR